MRMIIISVVVVLIIITALWLTSGSNEGILSRPGKLITLHHTNWCPHCKTMRPVWDHVKDKVSKADPSVKFREVDEDIAKTPGLGGVPTIFALIGGKKYRYTGGPDADKLQKWILSPVK